MNNNFYAPVRNSRHGGVTSLATDNSTTVSGTTGVSQAYVGVKILSGVFDISKLAIDASKGNRSAVESALTFQAEALASDFARQINRQFYGDGKGIVAQVLASGGSIGSGSIGVMPPNASNDGGREDQYGTVNGDVSPTKYIAPSNFIGVGTNGNDKGTVSSVTGTSIVLTGACTTAANDSIYIIDGSLAGAGSSEFTGIGAALSSSTGTSTYANLARNTPGWTPAFGSVSEALTLSRMESAYLSAKEYAQLTDKYAIFVNKTLYKKYGDILTAMRRAVAETDLLGGWTGLEFAAGAGRVGVFLDYDVPDGEDLVLNLDTFTICQVSDLDWMESPNEGAMLRIANRITYQATMVWFANLLCLCPAANAKECQKTA